MSDRLSRKEIKRQDTFQVLMGRALETVQAYRRQIILVSAVLVLAVLAFVGWYIYVESIEDDAQVLLAQAIEARSETADAATDGAGEGRARSRELLERVVEDYGATDAADVARVYLGEMAVAEGDTERAAELWRDFLDEHPRHMLGAQVRLNLYALERGAGRGQEVVTELQEMVDAENPALPQDVALYELAVTLEELGREEEAAERYQRLVDEFSQSPYAMEARRKTGGGAAGFPGLPS